MSKTKEKNTVSFEDLDPRQFIIVKGARVNNLKNLDVAIPRNKLIVITGLSGSGKSSLAFDTLFAEGQRMYVESLSSYARQFLGRMEKPEVDYIKGLSPAIAIEQKVNTRNSRSTVGTTTEIYDYLKLLFARIGKTISPKSGREVKSDSVTDVVNFIKGLDEGAKVMITCPLVFPKERLFKEELKILLGKGYTRLLRAGETVFIEDLKGSEKSSEFEILIDRLVKKDVNEDFSFRVADSVQTAFFESNGYSFIYSGKDKSEFSNRFELDDIQFEKPTVNFFSFNNPYGACERCEGFGKILGLDEDLIIPDKEISVYEGAVAPWRSQNFKKWLEPLIKLNESYNFPIHRSYNKLNKEELDILWNGRGSFEGIWAFFKFVEAKLHKIQYRVMLSRYRGKTVCPDCKGSRLRKDASFVKINGKSITDLVLMQSEDSHAWFKNIELPKFESKVAERILTEISTRLDYLNMVGLGYLSLNRLTGSLSGGEFQRIKLSTSLGSALVGSMYVLDEPSIGLHPRDTGKLIQVIKGLQKMGNTVIVVEHEEEVMMEADQIIDIGPEAGTGGGNLVFQGSVSDIRKGIDSHTVRYLLGEDRIEIPVHRRKWRDKIIIYGAKENNLKNIDIEFPLNTLTVVTGVSGSGKSTLINSILCPSVGRYLGTVLETPGKFKNMGGDYRKITQLEFVDQNPIGKSSRSNPVTYIKAYDAIRQLFSSSKIAENRGYKPAFFSFNVDGGRCEECQGDGTIKIEMQFMADIFLTCESCKGSRFKREILDVLYHEKSIADVLELTVDEAIEFFEDEKSIINKLKPLQDVGLGYIKLGQSSNSLSGGEAQRVKLASFLGKQSKSEEHILFVFDEPTTGLHFHDINKLLKAINALIDAGNSVIIIEHNMEVIKTADWIIDLGPEGGMHGGGVCFTGTPEEMIKLENNYTAKYLSQKIVI